MKNPKLKEILTIIFKKPEKKTLINFLSAFLILFITVYLLHFAINESLDWELLFLFNPDSYIPVLDELMVMITDFSFYFSGFGLGIYFIGYLLYRVHNFSFERIQRIMIILGLCGGTLIISLAFWADYTYWVIFFPFGLIFFGTISWIGTIYRKLSDETLDQVAKIIITVLISVALDLIMEGTMKPLVGRPRPFNSANASLNGGLRQIPDEVVSRGNSYFSGHSSGLFMLLTPFIWTEPRRSRKFLLFLWGTIHGFTRLYLAAHFPYDVLIGCLVGIACGTIAVKLFFREKLYFILRVNPDSIILENAAMFDK